MLEKHLALCIAFGPRPVQKSLLLLGIDVFDKALFGFEIESHRVALIFVAAHCENRQSLQSAFGRRVCCASGMHHVAIEIHADAFAGQIHIFVFYLARPIEMCRSRCGVVDQ